MGTIKNDLQKKNVVIYVRKKHLEKSEEKKVFICFYIEI